MSFHLIFVLDRSQFVAETPGSRSPIIGAPHCDISDHIGTRARPMLGRP